MSYCIGYWGSCKCDNCREKMREYKAERRLVAELTGICKNCKQKAVENKKYCQYHIEKAKERYKREKEKRKKTYKKVRKIELPIEHGTRHSYMRGCRCEDCTASQREYQNARYHKLNPNATYY